MNANLTFNRKVLYYLCGFLLMIGSLFVLRTGRILFSSCFCPSLDGFVPSLTRQNGTYICQYHKTPSTFSEWKSLYELTSERSTGAQRLSPALVAANGYKTESTMSQFAFVASQNFDILYYSCFVALYLLFLFMDLYGMYLTMISTIGSFKQLRHPVLFAFCGIIVGLPIYGCICDIFGNIWNYW